METALVSKNFWGDELYQKRAREALPILVRQAICGETIHYSQLASELNIPNARNLNYVLGCIGNTLQEESEAHGVELPPIQCLVVNKETGLPGEGVGQFISNVDFRALNKKQRHVLVQSQLAKIYAFPDWLKVLEVLGLQPPQFTTILKQQIGFSGGEGERHNALKRYIAENPHFIGLAKSLPKGDIEYYLPSGDSVDVMFVWRNQFIAVEVKSRISTTEDLVRGMFQCIKYQSVTEAMLGVQGLPQNVRTILVLESKMPLGLKKVQHMLGIEIIDEVEMP